MKDHALYKNQNQKNWEFSYGFIFPAFFQVTKYKVVQALVALSRFIAKVKTMGFC